MHDDLCFVELIQLRVQFTVFREAVNSRLPVLARQKICGENRRNKLIIEIICPKESRTTCFFFLILMFCGDSKRCETQSSVEEGEDDSKVPSLVVP